MSFYSFFGICGGALAVVGYIIYIVSIVRGQTKPHFFTWFLWGIMSIIALVVAFRNDAGWGILVPGIMALANLVISIFALLTDLQYSKRDIILLVCTLLIFPIWSITTNDLLAILLVCIIDSVGIFFTAKKSYSKPFEENIVSYILWSLEFICAFLAIENLSLTNGFYPAYLAITEMGLVIFLLARRITAHRISE